MLRGSNVISLSLMACALAQLGFQSQPASRPAAAEPQKWRHIVKPFTSREQPEPTEEAIRAAQHLTDVFARYARMQTYQDEMRYRFVLDATVDGRTIKFDRPCGLAFVRPRAVRIQTGGITCYFAGARQSVMAFESLREFQSGYMQLSPNPGSLVHVLPEGDGQHFMPHPILFLLLAKEGELQHSFPRVSAHRVTDQVRDGRQFKTVVAEAFDAGLFMGLRRELTIWIAEDSGLIEEMTLDMTAWLQRMSATLSPESPSTLREAYQRYEFTNIRVDEPIAREKFEFRPDDDWKRVDRFSARLSDSSVSGRPAETQPGVEP